MPAPEHRREVEARLFKAIEQGDVQAVMELLEIDQDLVEAANSEGASPLIWAAYYRRREIGELLISRGVRPDIFEASALNLNSRARELLESDRTWVDRYSFDGWTPLHLAAHFGSVDVLRTLLANGASHRATSHNSNGNQPLQAAASGRQIETVTLLLEAGADPDAGSESGFTALHTAAASGDVDMTRNLLEAGATVDVMTEGGKTPMDLAIEADHAAIVDTLEAAQGGQGNSA